MSQDNSSSPDVLACSESVCWESTRHIDIQSSLSVYDSHMISTALHFESSRVYSLTGVWCHQECLEDTDRYLYLTIAVS